MGTSTRTRIVSIGSRSGVPYMFNIILTETDQVSREVGRKGNRLCWRKSSCQKTSVSSTGIGFSLDQDNKMSEQVSVLYTTRG